MSPLGIWRLTILFPALFLTGCYSLAYRDEARSLLKADKILVVLHPNANRPDMPFSVGERHAISQVDDQVSTEGRRVMDAYGIVDPLNGVANNFLQALPSEIIQGTVVYKDKCCFDPFELDGWVQFQTLTWELVGWRGEGEAAEYYLNYWVQAKIFHNSGKRHRKTGAVFMETLWGGNCEIIQIAEFPLPYDRHSKGHTLSTWLENNASLLKESLTSLEKTCGEKLARDLLTFLQP